MAKQGSKATIKSKKQARPNPLPMFFVGAGLIVIGLAAWLLLIREKPEPAQASAPRTSSVTPARVEYPAPALELEALGGGAVSLAGLSGQVVLVNNWATWCPPCRAEMPALQAFYESHRQQDFTLVAVNAGDPTSEVTRFVESYGLTFPVWLDPTSKALLAFRNQSLPSSYVIDRTGTVRLAWTGAISEAMLEKYVTPLLEE